jgi:carbon monoxide dehydrogenase subunit G
MPLKIEGNVVVDAPRQVVWDSLFDVQVLKDMANKIPGISVERIDQVSETEYDATATIGVAMVKGKYDGKITILERRPLEYVKIRGEGKGGGNWTKGEVEVTLTPQDGRTLMNYLGTGNISGQLASVGQRLIDTVGRQFADQGAKVFAEGIAARQLEKAGAVPVTLPVAQRAIPTWAVPLAVSIVVLVALAIYFGLSR